MSGMSNAFFPSDRVTRVYTDPFHRDREAAMKEDLLCCLASGMAPLDGYAFFDDLLPCEDRTPTDASLARPGWFRSLTRRLAGFLLRSVARAGDGDDDRGRTRGLRHR